MRQLPAARNGLIEIDLGFAIRPGSAGALARVLDLLERR